MAFSKITDEERLGKGNVGQPDTPLLTTTEMQEQMDSLPNLAINGLNRLVDELESVYGAQSLGMTVPPAVTAQPNVYSIVNALALLVTSVMNAKHSHANKVLLDSLTEAEITELNTLTTIFEGIESVQGVITDTPSAVPTSEAVVNFVAAYNYKTIIRDAIFPIGSVYATTSMTPDQIFGTTGCWTLYETTSNGVNLYRRTS